ncbi:maestro heat-like repeat-containing protein family member 1 [Cyanistes caeruleus]|uniref:maestro heat-like repeat-containing protein family member 1 n=1 Tax=Cyanistes caeruleus TaxID=156563 RepID=UPI000CDAE4BD|nr:maestro heat-like repeat-containing protein family member 1 [Cyanistes caeruleus]
MGIPERHHEGIALLAGAMARLMGPRLPPIVRSLIPILGSVFECQRVTGTAFLAELLSHRVVTDLILLEPILESLRPLEKDPSVLVRILALRGLGNAASGSPEKVGRDKKKIREKSRDFRFFSGMFFPGLGMGSFPKFPAWEFPLGISQIPKFPLMNP